MVHPNRKSLCCLLLVCLSVSLAGCGAFNASPSGTPITETTPTPDPTASPTQTTGGVHGTTYPVDIEVTVSVVSNVSALDVEAPTLADANLTEEQRTAVITAIEADEPVTWSGQSDETAPADIRTLVAASDRLPPTNADRDPAEAWQVARETTGYVTYQNTTYKLQMVKIAP
ncbi:hypothetical protein [Halomarina oriensis]|uniref:Uncharacterized protein n=1 Tax=Halomarina oriensis TaxID=671145 RepID=A0A6B0GLZ4_9EURY|nr:hypothetical protein [Halomarina oriensis]MWG33783.1 hypothetical protein [Halomarina oriensis]